MKWSAYHWRNANIGFSVDNDEGHAVGEVAPDADGVWSMAIVSEAYHPADFVSSTDLRNIAMVIDHLNSGETP